MVATDYWFTTPRDGSDQGCHPQPAAKLEMFYDYLVSPKFRQRISDIVEAFSEMHGEIEKEKRAMTRSWARREKLIERVTHGTATMYGDLEGIMGSEIASLPALEMPYALGEGEEDAEGQ